MYQILAYVYLVEYKAVLFSAFSTFYHHFTVIATPTACWVGISGSGYAIVMHVIRRRLRVERLKVQPGHTADYKKNYETSLNEYGVCLQLLEAAVYLYKTL